MISASKYHSYGNDFLIVPPDQIRAEEWARLAKAICDRRLGVGADGCVIVSPSLQGRFLLRIFNRDGSEAGMSGNGVRCACAYLHHHDLTDARVVELETRSGLKVYELLAKTNSSWEYRSRMGTPVFSPSAIPFQAEPGVERIENYPLQVEDELVRITTLSVGNPQCVVFVDELPQLTCFEKIGAGLESHPRFPERTNVSFVKIEDLHRIYIKIWERGVGPTQSSGTGACGAAVAAISSGKARSPVQVFAEIGSQQVEWSAGEEIILVGRAEFIAEIQFNWRMDG